MGSEKKGISLLPDLQGKGYIFKALGQAWLTISCWKWTHWGCRYAYNICSDLGVVFAYCFCLSVDLLV